MSLIEYNVPMIQDCAHQIEACETLTAEVHDADQFDENKVSYQWLRDGKEIAGANGKTYTLTAGSQITVVDTALGKLGLAICFDIRFAEFFRVMGDLGAQLILVPAAIARFRASRPGVAIELNDLSTHHQLLALAEGRLDLGFCRLPAPKGWPVLPVVRAHFVAVLPAGYQGVAGLADLQEKPLAILRRDKAPSFHDQFVHYLAQSGLRFQDIQYVNDFAAGIATAAAGIAWTLVPSSTTIEHPDVLTLPLGEADASWIIGLIRPPGNDNPLVAPFWQTVAELADPALTGLMTTGDGAAARDTP